MEHHGHPFGTKTVEHIQGLLRAGWEVDRIAKWLDIPWTWVDLVRKDMPNG